AAAAPDAAASARVGSAAVRASPSSSMIVSDSAANAMVRVFPLLFHPSFTHNTHIFSSAPHTAIPNVAQFRQKMSLLTRSRLLTRFRQLLRCQYLAAATPARSRGAT
ncbi:unnamed protein product, partial [Pylaiella littoralis]